MIVGQYDAQGLGVFGNPNQRPQITLNGGSTVHIRQGRVWTDPGATVTDDIDGVIAVYSGVPVDTSKAGAVYNLPYNYTDTGGLKAETVTRKVIVDPMPRGNNAVSFLMSAGPE